jgi:hypothetical protein
MRPSPSSSAAPLARLVEVRRVDIDSLRVHILALQSQLERSNKSREEVGTHLKTGIAHYNNAVAELGTSFDSLTAATKAHLGAEHETAAANDTLQAIAAMVGHTGAPTSSLGPGDSVFKLFGDTCAEPKASTEPASSQHGPQATVGKDSTDGVLALEPASETKSVDTADNGTRSAEPEAAGIRPLTEHLASRPGPATMEAVKPVQPPLGVPGIPLPKSLPPWKRSAGSQAGKGQGADRGPTQDASPQARSAPYDVKSEIPPHDRWPE